MESYNVQRSFRSKRPSCSSRNDVQKSRPAGGARACGTEPARLAAALRTAPRGRQPTFPSVPCRVSALEPGRGRFPLTLLIPCTTLQQSANVNRQFVWNYRVMVGLIWLGQPSRRRSKAATDKSSHRCEILSIEVGMFFLVCQMDFPLRLTLFQIPQWQLALGMQKIHFKIAIPGFSSLSDGLVVSLRPTRKTPPLEEEWEVRAPATSGWAGGVTEGAGRKIDGPLCYKKLLSGWFHW